MPSHFAFKAHIFDTAQIHLQAFFLMPLYYFCIPHYFWVGGQTAFLQPMGFKPSLNFFTKSPLPHSVIFHLVFELKHDIFSIWSLTESMVLCKLLRHQDSQYMLPQVDLRGF